MPKQRTSARSIESGLRQLISAANAARKGEPRPKTKARLNPVTILVDAGAAADRLWRAYDGLTDLISDAESAIVGRKLPDPLSNEN